MRPRSMLTALAVLAACESNAPTNDVVGVWQIDGDGSTSSSALTLTVSPALTGRLGSYAVQLRRDPFDAYLVEDTSNGDQVLCESCVVDGDSLTCNPFHSDGECGSGHFHRVSSTPLRQPTVVVDHLDNPDYLAVAGDHLYFTESEAPKKLRRVPISGGRVEDVATIDGNPSVRFAANGSTLYWIAGDPEGVRSVGPDGRVSSLVSLRSGFGQGLAIDHGMAYFTTDSAGSVGGKVQYADGTLWSVPLTGGSPKQLAHDASGSYGDVVAQGGEIYWTTNAGIMHLPATGGTPKSLVPGPLDTPLLVGDAAGHLYFHEAYAGALKMATADGRVTTIATVAGAIAQIAADGTNVYFGTFDFHGGGSVESVPAAGGPVALLTGSDARPIGVVTTADAIFWVNGGAGTIERLAKSAATPTGQR